MAHVLVAASSQYLEINSAPVTAAPLTLACWFKTTSVGAGVDHHLVWLGNSGVTNQHYFTLEQYQTEIYCGTRAAGGLAEISVTGVTANTWHHAVAVFASQTSRTPYLNGTAGGTNTTDVAPSGLNRLDLGRRGFATPDGYHDGSLAEVAVWNAALSGSDITLLAGGVSPMALATKPVRYWRLKASGDLTDLVAKDVLTDVGTTWTSDHSAVIDPPGALSTLGVGA